MKKKDSKTSVKPMLSWRCIDDFDKAYPDNVCCVGSFDISKRKAVILREVFAAMKEKWTKELLMLFSEEEEGFEIAGGNYSFFFILPCVLKHFRENHPFLRVKLSFIDVDNPDDLGKYNADCLLTSFFASSGLFGDVEQFKAQISKNGYSFNRWVYYDAAYLAASKESGKKYGSKKNVLAKDNVVLGKVYENYNLRKFTNLSHEFAPSNRAKEEPRIIIDFYFMSYHLMSQCLGISYVFASDRSMSNFLILEEKPITTLVRFPIFKKDIRNSYKKTFSKGIKESFR